MSEGARSLADARVLAERSCEGRNSRASQQRAQSAKAAIDDRLLAGAADGRRKAVENPRRLLADHAGEFACTLRRSRNIREASEKARHQGRYRLAGH